MYNINYKIGEDFDENILIIKLLKKSKGVLK